MIPQPIVNELAPRFGTSREKLAFLGGGREGSDGTVYSFRDGDREAVLKIMEMRPGEENTLADIRARLQYARYLGENAVPIVYPELSAAGNLLEELTREGKNYIAYRMPKAPGELAMQVELDEGHVREWGRMLGRLHSCARRYPGSFEHLGWQHEWEGFFRWCKDDEVRQKWQELKTELEQLPTTPDCYGFIHNDPHPGNILVDGDRLTLLDFDVAMPHWYAHDIGISLYSAITGNAGGFEKPQKNSGFARQFLELFMSGYEQENHLDPVWLDRLELFMHYRRTLLFIVFYEALQKRSPDHFQHWRQRILARAPIFTY